MTQEWYPLAAFYFQIEFSNKSEIYDMEFQEVSGLSVEFETEEVEEGGETRFKHRVLTRQKHGNLVCKRALRPLKESALAEWLNGILESDFSQKIEPVDAFVSLLNAEGKKLCGWSLTNLYPVKWDIGLFNSQKNEPAIETIEFAYNTINRKL